MTKHKGNGLGCVLGAALLAGLTAHGQSSDEIVIIEKAQSRIVLVLPAQPQAAEKLAAKELVEHLAKITGVTVAEGVTPRPGLIPVYLGSAADPEVRRQAVLPDSFCLRVQADRIDAAGAGEGTAFAIYELLEQVGVRWFMPGELGTVIPELQTVKLAIQTTVQAPSFAGRHFQMNEPGWQTRLRCGGPNFPGAHGLVGIHPRDFEAHPEFFSLVKGRRTPQQICVSNPEVLSRTIAATKAFFRQNPGESTVGMGPNDGSGFCECEACRALDAGDLDPFSGEASTTDRYIWFFNKVLAGIKDEFPDKKIGFYIYHTYMRPPLREKPDPRITGALAPIALCRVHGPDNPVCPESAYYPWLAREWGKRMPELWDRGYWSNLADPGFPFIIVHRLREQIPMGKQAGIYGWRVETFPHWGTQLPSMYIAAKLMWNSQADVEALMQDFAGKFFGPAAEPMGDYIALMDASLRDADFHTGSAWDMPHFYPAGVRAKARALLDKGAKLAPEGIYAQRVAMIRQTFDLLESFITMQEARNNLDFPAAKTALDQANTVAATLKSYKPPMIAARLYDGYMERFFKPCIEQGAARVAGGNRLIAACADEWEFLLDPAKVGFDLGYFAPRCKGGNWQKTRAYSLSWSDQGLRYYHGLAWYRQTIEVPAKYAGQRVFLWCGGVDEVARVWVNGKAIGTSHDAAFWPFELDATPAVQAGTNTVVIAVDNQRVDELGTGGLMAPVLLYAPKEGNNATLENTYKPKPTFP